MLVLHCINKLRKEKAKNKVGSSLFRLSQKMVCDRRKEAVKAIKDLTCLCRRQTGQQSEMKGGNNEHTRDVSGICS